MQFRELHFIAAMNWAERYEQLKIKLGVPSENIIERLSKKFPTKSKEYHES